MEFTVSKQHQQLGFLYQKGKAAHHCCLQLPCIIRLCYFGERFSQTHIYIQIYLIFDITSQNKALQKTNIQFWFTNCIIYELKEDFLDVLVSSDCCRSHGPQSMYGIAEVSIRRAVQKKKIQQIRYTMEPVEVEKMGNHCDITKNSTSLQICIPPLSERLPSDLRQH